MLTPDYYESCVDDILKLYAQLEDDIISDIVRRMMKTGFVTESAKHQAEMLQNAGLLYDDILSEIAKRTDATSQHVKALFEDAGVRTVNFDNQIYRAVGRVPVDIRQSPAMRQTLESGYRKTLGNMQNLTLTTANMAQSTYYSACNQAYMQVVSGAFSYQEAIKKAVQKTAQDGAFVLYPSGHRDRVDVAVRRSVLTGVGQTCREIGLMNAEENDCDLMELSAHFGARPTHAEWQGQIVSLSGRKGYLSLDSIGYGTGDGFGGWNCRHDWFPYFEGYSRRNYTDNYLKSLNEKNIEYNGEKYSQYEISQIQRKYEREIRSAKREKVAFDTAVKESADPELKSVMKSGSDYANQQIKDKQAKMRDFIQQTGQSRDYFREQNYGRVAYVKNSLNQSDNGFINKMKNILTGKSYLNTVNEFAESLQNMQNKEVATLLQKVYENTVFEKSRRKNSYFNSDENKVYISKSATFSTIAHELFHKIDYENGISINGILNKSIDSDYENIKNIAKRAGLSIEDMLYLNYPEAFENKGKIKEEYRGFSDIIHGMTKGAVNLGYGHFQKDYWNKPLKLQKETFAQYGRFYYDNNVDVLRIVNEMLPKTSNQMKILIGIIDRFGG